MIVNLKTGYGYVHDNNGHVLYKFIHPIGPFKFPDNEIVVEVENEQAFNAIVVNPPVDTVAQRKSVIANRDRLFQQIDILGEIVLYLAESEAIKAGRMTEAQRTVTGARALKIAMYMRDLYRVQDQADLTNVTWPTPP